MTTIYIVSLEPVETRYTCQWFTGFPSLLNEEIKKRGLDSYKIEQINGDILEDTGTTEGAFLNFAATNIWKSQQAIKVAELFNNGKVCKGDKFIFTDFWNPTILQLRYMSDLLGIPVQIHSIVHAGSYDPQDFLGRLITDKRWTYATEQALFYASTYNYFATEFHRDMFVDTVFADLSLDGLNGISEKIALSGQPHNVLVESLQPFAGMPKKKQILFPHRIAPEKQVEIFRDLADYLPEANFVVCQDRNLSKDEYHTLLGESMIVFSANLQETLGISAMEGVLVGAVPFLPDRLSYSEMYHTEFLYPPEWTESFESYLEHREEIVDSIRKIMDGFDVYQEILSKQKKILLDWYLHPSGMIDRLFDDA